jgi:hypothetical protein
MQIFARCAGRRGLSFEWSPKIEDFYTLLFIKMSDTETSSTCSSSSEHYKKGLTLEKLLDLLQEVLKEDPDMKKMPVYHTEFGGLVRLRTVEVCDEINGRKVKRFLVLE